VPLLLAASLLAGCNSVGGIVGGISGTTTGIATGNAAVGYAVGVGIRSAVDATVQYVMRSIKRNEQTTIASIAAGIEPGTVMPWRVRNALPFGYGDAEGTVQVTRIIDNPLTQCREVAIGVGEGEEQRTLVATTCRQQDGRWGWASAEPSVARWGGLQ
jgi:surface antigen